MIQSKADYKYYLNRDKQANGVPLKPSVFWYIKQSFFPHEEWNFIKRMRYLEYCQNVVRKKGCYGWVLWLFAKYRFRRISLKLGYSIPINVFGPGLSLPHRGNIVINPNTQIGENCRIHVGVNIGAHKDKAPKIGDNVYIGPGAIYSVIL